MIVQFSHTYQAGAAGLATSLKRLHNFDRAMQPRVAGDRVENWFSTSAAGTNHDASAEFRYALFWRLGRFMILLP